MNNTNIYQVYETMIEIESENESVMLEIFFPVG